jgi:hypothetical protein
MIELGMGRRLVDRAIRQLLEDQGYGEWLSSRDIVSMRTTPDGLLWVLSLEDGRLPISRRGESADIATSGGLP